LGVEDPPTKVARRSRTQQKSPPWPKAPRIRFARQIPKAPGKGRCFQEVGSSKLFVVLQRFKPFRAKGEEFSNTTTQRSRDLQEFHFSKVRRAASIGFALCSQMSIIKAICVGIPDYRVGELVTSSMRWWGAFGYTSLPQSLGP
jgi:hypothetical protein